tara:strand:+ start:297 stop:479 length:183 start_codon:yes stop_codon:yes gene_type:complete
MSKEANWIPKSAVVEQMITSGAALSTACHPALSSPEAKAKYLHKQTKRFTATWRKLQTKD